MDQEVIKLAHEVVSQIGLALANLRLRESLRKSSIIDALTGLYNRRYLDETIPRQIARAERTGQPLGVIMLDIDHFKMFNDNYGHDAGDVALREVGTLLKNACRISDLACRFGGKEFMIILPQADVETTAARADIIRWEVKKLHLTYGAASLRPSLSLWVLLLTHCTERGMRKSSKPLTLRSTRQSAWGETVWK